MAYPDAYDTALLALSPNVYWPCDDPAGGTNSGGNFYVREATGLGVAVWFPYPGGGYGTLGNPSILPGATGTSFHKAGANSLQITWAGLSAGGRAAVAPQPPMTFCCWFNPDNVLGGDAAGNGNSGLYGQFFGYNAGLRWESLQIGGVAAPTPRVFVPSNTYFLVHTYDGASSIVYVNGVSQGAVATTGAVATNTNNVELCGLINVGSLQGYIQKVALFPAVLTPAQIQSLYIAGAASVAEAAGVRMNVYPFSRQVIQNAPTALVNDSDTPMYVGIGATPVLPHQGARINPNGGRWSSPPGYSGALQIVHSAVTGAKTATFG